MRKDHECVPSGAGIISQLAHLVSGPGRAGHGLPRPKDITESQNNRVCIKSICGNLGRKRGGNFVEFISSVVESESGLKLSIKTWNKKRRKKHLLNKHGADAPLHGPLRWQVWPGGERGVAVERVVEEVEDGVGPGEKQRRTRRIHQTLIKKYYRFTNLIRQRWTK